MRFMGPMLLIVALSSGAWAETVTTTDGRRLELNTDGTYQLLTESSAPAIQMKEQTPYFIAFAGEYDQNSIRFMPIFRNETGKIVVGFKFRTKFKSAFGDEVFSFEGESSERIRKDSSSTASTYYFFEDNKFISDQPYDKLVIFQSAGTGSISTTVTAVVFDGGTVIKSEDQ